MIVYLHDTYQFIIVSFIFKIILSISPFYGYFMSKINAGSGMKNEPPLSFFLNKVCVILISGDIVCNYIAFYLLYYIVLILELQFAFTALSINARFRAVNDALANTARHLSATGILCNLCYERFLVFFNNINYQRSYL